MARVRLLLPLDFALFPYCFRRSYDAILASPKRILIEPHARRKNMSRWSKFILTLLFAGALSAPQSVSADDFSIQPPPPPDTLELALGTSFGIT